MNENALLVKRYNGLVYCDTFTRKRFDSTNSRYAAGQVVMRQPQKHVSALIVHIAFMRNSALVLV